ncbi:MAG: ribonuclease P protein component 1 [Candidatus Aenigmarchaeota archaeon]|nr:ribonuclease P protein component 1 [Candidatus Aenigmarchaeota archaeon]
MISEKNLIRHELIGLDVEVFESTNKTNKGKSGVVVDETKNMLTIETCDGPKRIQKKGTQFIFKIPDGKRVKVDGKRIIAKPEDRIKLKVKKW